MWQRTTGEEKAPYIELAREDKERYQRALLEYNRSLAGEMGEEGEADPGHAAAASAATGLVAAGGSLEEEEEEELEGPVEPEAYSSHPPSTTGLAHLPLQFVFTCCIQFAAMPVNGRRLQIYHLYLQGQVRIGTRRQTMEYD